MSDPQSTKPGEAPLAAGGVPGAEAVTPAGAQATPQAAAKTLAALDPPTTPFVIGGMIVWLIAWLVVYLGFRDDHPSWPAICVAGLVLGLPGLAVMIVHDRHRRARRDPRETRRRRPDVG